MIFAQDEPVAVLSRIMLSLWAICLGTIAANAAAVDFTGARLSDDWNKKALSGSLSPHGLRIMAKGDAKFNDASSWTVTLAAPIAVKPNQALVFTIATGRKHRPLWQNLLFALRINGKPAEAIYAQDVAEVDLMLADNGERYAPFNDAGRFKMAVRVPGKALKSLTLLTAGAAGLDITVDGFTLQVRGKSQIAETKAPVITLSKAQLSSAAQEAWQAFAAFSAETGSYDLRDDPARQAVLLKNQRKVLDVSGGWFDAGDYGRYTVNTAHSATVILLSHILAPDAVTEEALEKSGVRGALGWLLKMQREDGAAHHKVASAQFAGMTTKPAADRAKRFVAPVTSTATAQLATALHLGALVYGKPSYAKAAEKAQAWLGRNPGLAMIPARFGRHAYGGHYGDKEDDDERFMALAAQQFRTGKTALTEKEFTRMKRRFLKTRNDAGWKNADLFALWIVAASGHGRAHILLQDTASRWQAAQTRSPFHVPHRSGDPVLWGFNGRIALRAWHMALAGQTFGRPDWAQAARTSMGWFFGGNPNRQIMVTGKGEGRIKHPHFRPHTSGAIALPEGLLVGGPNQDTKMKSRPPLARHVDSAKSYRTNEVAINWQAAFASALSIVAHQSNQITTGSVPLP